MMNDEQSDYLYNLKLPFWIIKLVLNESMKPILVFSIEDNKADGVAYYPPIN